MKYSEFTQVISSLGFEGLKEFTDFSQIPYNNILEWQEENLVPKHIEILLTLIEESKSNSTDIKEIDTTKPEIDLNIVKNIENMLGLQKELNDETNGQNWECGITKDNKEINWLRAIAMECAELVDETAWKHWHAVSSKANWDDIHLELVDIWHFVMSYMLANSNISQITNSIKYSTIYNTNENLSEKTMREETENLMYYALMAQRHNHLDENDVQQVLVQSFFSLCKEAGLSFKLLYKIYIGKHTLNKFRQHHGYKMGKYTKIWNGIEDNEVMLKLIKKTDEIDPKTLTSELEDIYNKTSEAI